MNKSTNNQHRRMFTRLRSDLPPLKITDRDLSILNLVYEYRFMNTAQIQALVSGSNRNITERLSRLFHHGYLDRPTHQRELRSMGYRLMIYAVSLAGARLLAKTYSDNSYIKLHLNESNRNAKQFYLAHTLMISQFRTCLTVACHDRSDLVLSGWQTPDRPLARVKIDRRRSSVIPDGYFIINKKDNREAHFYLEADRGTMTQQRFLRKLQAYWQFYVSGPSLGLPAAFRVVTIATSKQRMENLVDTATNADNKKKGSRMFYFVCEDDYSLDEPGATLDHIWRTPADREKHSLLEGKRSSQRN